MSNDKSDPPVNVLGRLALNGCRSAGDVKGFLLALLSKVEDDAISVKEANRLGDLAQKRLRSIKAVRDSVGPQFTITQGGRMLDLFKNDDRYGLVTDCADERTFMEQFAAALAAVTVKEEDEVERATTVENWLKQCVEVVCKLRGYKSTVRTRSLIEAGEFTPGQSALEAKVDEQGRVSFPETSLASSHR